MSRYRVTLAYDGTDFHGWQIQPGSNQRTIQGVVERALGCLARNRTVRVVSAGRTDAGVHALGQEASFELPSEIEPGEIQRALNGLLPADVRALEVRSAEPGFHPRRSALFKLYRYVLDTGSIQQPIRRRYAGWLPGTLQADRVCQTAALYLGRCDFASVGSAGGSTRTTVRTVTRSEARFEGSTLVYEVEADGFLRKMVRSLVGGLVAAGNGSRSVEDLKRALEQRDRRAWPAPAPACGLTLIRVVYPTDRDDPRPVIK